jgi:site-specific recombinase XerD
MKPTDFAYHLSRYFSIYLPGEIGSSKNTILSYRDTFKLLLVFAKSEGVKEGKLTFGHVDKAFVSRFLSWIENERNCCVGTRNQRLAAIHAFFSYMQSELPDLMFGFQEILAIPMKRHHQKTVDFMSDEGIKILLAQPDIKKRSGRKHLVILSFLFATGCRVQELCDMHVADVMYNDNTVSKITGKGNKSRYVPLDTPFVNLLRQYLEELGFNDAGQPHGILFKNHSGRKYTRQGIAYIVKKYGTLARKQNPGLIPESISVHTIRHSKAISLLRSGVELIYIRDILGHVSVQTTEIYCRIDSEMKRKALEKASGNPVNNEMPVWQKDKSLMDWLKSLG